MRFATHCHPTDHPAFDDSRKRSSRQDSIHLMNIKGKETVESFHKRLGKIMWDKCGMARNAEGLKEAISRNTGN